jgi:hypothetical protein
MNLDLSHAQQKVQVVDFASMLRSGGHFDVEHWRAKKSGSLRLLDVTRERNLVVDEGLQYALGVSLAATSKISTWYVGIFETTYTPVAGDDLTALLGSATECTAYDEANRPTWSGVLGTLTITNSAARADFTINATKTIYGAWLSSIQAKSTGGGTLWAAAEFASSKAVVATDVLRVRYDCAVAAA